MRSSRSASVTGRSSRFISAAAAALALLGAAGAAHADAFKSEYDKGAAAFAAGDYAGALASFEKAYKIKPHPLCLFNMGQAHRKMEHIDEAIAAYEKYLATKPAPDLKAETEGYLAELGKAKLARTESEEARRLFGAGDFTGAAARYERAYAIRAEPSLLYATGLAYDKAGNKVKAIEYYERFLKTDTDPKLRADAETALKALRAEPDPAGAAGVAPRPGDGAPAGSAGPAGAGAGLAADPAPAKSGSHAVLFASLGVGAAVVVAAVVVTAVLLTGGPKAPPSNLGPMRAEAF